MIGKQGKHFTTANIFKKVCKTLFVTVTILSPNVLLNNCCIKIMVDTVNYGKRSHDEGDITPGVPRETSGRVITKGGLAKGLY